MVKELADGLQELAMEKETLDDQEALSASPNGGSPIDTCENEVHETVKSLGDKLSAALLNISAKEELVKQHSKVAEEAVSGWEKAETEVATLKQQLEASAQNNSSLEDKISHLDRALKECVRQLRQSKEEHEQKVQDAITKKTQEWDSKKSELENQVIDLKTQFEASTTKFEDMDKENAAIKVKLVTLLEQLKIRTLENELSTQTAETASKQHLESIKKVAKLEAECRKLKALLKKTPSSSACVESLTDSLSDNVDRSCSDSWASALIAELDQFKNEKSRAKVINTSVDIDIMDDFLEMERLASMPEADLVRDTSLEVGDEDVKQEMVEFEEKVKKLESEKAELEINLEQVQKELELAIELKQAARVEVESVEAKRKESESQLEAAMLEVEKLQDKLASLEGKVVLASELKTRLEASETTREAIQSRLHLAYTDVEKIQDKVGLLEGRIEEERALSAELTSKLETTEAQFLAASFEARNLQEKANLLEQRIEDENSLSLEFAAKVEAVEGKKNALESELALVHSEVQELTYKVALLEEELNSEKALSIKFAERCRNLEGELSRKRREAELRVAASSNGDLTLKQEKELTMSAEKLADCQKTIASLSRQLKSLITLDEINGGSPDFRSENAKLLNSIDPNGKDRGPTPWSTSSTSMLSGFGKLLPRSRSSSRIEN